MWGRGSYHNQCGLLSSVADRIYSSGAASSFVFITLRLGTLPPTLHRCHGLLFMDGCVSSDAFLELGPFLLLIAGSNTFYRVPLLRRVCSLPLRSLNTHSCASSLPWVAFYLRRADCFYTGAVAPAFVRLPLRSFAFTPTHRRLLWHLGDERESMRDG